MRFALIASALLLASCAPSHTRIVDGGILDQDGWPTRHRNPEARAPYRCPVGTFLSDEHVNGRRIVACHVPGAAPPRAFELIWSADGNGPLVSRTVFGEDNTPRARTLWFDSGVLAAEQQFVDGRLVHSTAWYENGERSRVLNYDPTQNVTMSTHYQPDGTIEAEGQMRNGERVGVWRLWRDGALEQVEFVAGFEQGPTVRTYPTGDVEHGQYAAGERVGVWQRVDSAGRPVREVEYVDGAATGQLRAYHPNRQLREEGTLLDGKKVGLWKSYHLTGGLSAEQNFVCDVLTGEAKTYYPTGTLHTRGVYQRGKKVGEWRVYSETGVETSIESHPPAAEEPGDDEPPTSCFDT